MGVYGDLGRYPLNIQWYVRIIKFWRHIVSSDNILVTYFYNNMVEACNKGAANWTRNMKLLLYKYGFSYVWNNLHAVNLSSFHLVFKERVIDIFKQTWIKALSQSSPLFIQRFQTWVGVRALFRHIAS